MSHQLVAPVQIVTLDTWIFLSHPKAKTTVSDIKKAAKKITIKTLKEELDSLKGQPEGYDDLKKKVFYLENRVKELEENQGKTEENAT